MDSDTLYHYCSVDTFDSILKKKEIWLSNTRFMNDLQEGRYIHELIRQGVKDDDEFVNFATNYKRIYGEAYVACFSENGDLLSLWERYANACRGFAIGFDKALLEELLAQITSDEPDEHDSSEGINLIKINYSKDVADLYGKLKKSYPSMFKKVPKHSLTMESFRNEDFGKTLWIYKHPFFDQELEHRIIYLPDKFKESNRDILGNKVSRLTCDGICDHFPLRFSTVENIVVRVVIGPLNKAGKSVIEGYLKNIGSSIAEVTYSDGCGVIK
ncbi:Protein of unknown function (DUF2971) [Nitrosospira sp. Nsp5]|uniref:DUF2971 family protein n=1 Tax=Nitrosospira multiformis TaxID=1231 RepID=A0ABY0TCN5_9PROT|nr:MULTISPECIES: DUF2971 domain-containing protein [Nitrosospira]PTR05880.1 Protein of unknown function (DUF2971) [Nitrosospira sp. Nsp5]SDQ60025.1 Protein of unknown function [Nitrosospira multiformis]